jgi:hypothetical protein
MAREVLLSIADRSRELVGLEDRQGWLALFGEDGIVEDPVGPAVHRGAGELGRFHRCFIAPNRISFRVLRDWVDESNGRVVRIVDICILMKDVGARHGVVQPAHLVYDVDVARGGVRRMQAHWEATSSWCASWPSVRGSLLDLLGATLASRFLLLHMGLWFALRFAWAFAAARLSRARTLVRGMAVAASRGDDSTFLAAFACSQRGVLVGGKLGSGGSCSAEKWLGSLRGSEFTPLASYTAGRQTTLWYRRAQGGRVSEGFWLVQTTASLWSPRVEHVYTIEEPLHSEPN